MTIFDDKGIPYGRRRAASCSTLASLICSVALAGPLPTQWQTAILNAADVAPGDNMGFAVDVDSLTATAVVGARFDWGLVGIDQGSVYVYVQSGIAWPQQAKLYASDTNIGDVMGHSVAISGDTLAAGAHLRDDLAGANQGAVYVFVRSGTTWSQQAKIIPADASANDSFGFSVDLDGDTLVVGATTDDTFPMSDHGSVYVFTRTAGVWSQQAKLLALDRAGFDNFGQAVALDGNVLVVGSPNDDGPAGADQGAAYAFVRSGSAWTQQAKLIAADAAAGDQLGFDVSVSGSRTVLGAVGDDGPAGGGQGSAYVFHRIASVWTQSAKLLPPDPAGGDGFGASVAIDGATAIIGSYNDDGTVGVNQGSAYLFSYKTSWVAGLKLVASDAAPSDKLGYSAAISGALAAIGPFGDILTDGANAAYLYSFGCLQDADCLDTSVCTCDRCLQFECVTAAVSYGNCDCSGIPDLDDVVCCLAGFADYYSCVNADIAPPCTGDAIVDVDDLLGVLDSFAGFGAGTCGCPE